MTTNNQSTNQPKKDSEDWKAFLKNYQTNLVYRDQKSILETQIDAIDIIGQGKNEKEAYAKAFESLKEMIYKKHNNFIVHLEPLDIIELKDDTDLKSKRIMGLLPHKRLSWEISLRIIYQVKFIKDI